MRVYDHKSGGRGAAIGTAVWGRAVAEFAAHTPYTPRIHPVHREVRGC